MTLAAPTRGNTTHCFCLLASHIVTFKRRVPCWGMGKRGVAFPSPPDKGLVMCPVSAGEVTSPVSLEPLSRHLAAAEPT